MILALQLIGVPWLFFVFLERLLSFWQPDSASRHSQIHYISKATFQVNIFFSFNFCLCWVAFGPDQSLRSSDLTQCTMGGLDGLSSSQENYPVPIPLFLSDYFVRKHFTGGFLFAVLDLSWILCSLLIPEYSEIKRRGKPLLGPRNPCISFISFSIWWKVTIYNPLLIWIAFWPYGLYCSLLPW